MLTYNLKKAAMFGLDARIALAIFGALSAISGAALYSAIQQSKAVATVAQLEELAKAHVQYYLDTGELAKNNTASSFWHLVEDIDDTPGWNGPYVSIEKGTSYTRLSGPTPIGNYEYTTSFYETGPWGADDSNLVAGPVICDDGDPCSLYVGIVATKDLAMAEKIDEVIDGTVDYKNGNFRIYHGTGTEYWLWYKVMSIN